MAGRTKYVVMTNEARVLKQLREDAGLSMREAGEKMGVSGSLVSQVENGRENAPKGQKLTRFLDVYGVSFSSFRKYVIEFKKVETDKEVVLNLIGKISQKDMATLRVLVEHFLVKN